MNNDWVILPFAEAVEINPNVPLIRNKIYPFVEMQKIDPSSRIVTPSKLRAFNGGGSRFKNGDTLMARITPSLENGKIAKYKNPEDVPFGHGSTEFIVIRGKEGVTDNDFVYYLTRSDLVRNYAITQMTGTSGRQRVPVDSLYHLDVPIPPLHEQRAIAHILGTLDDKIELNRRMNETLEAMARALFKAWFVDFEPVRAKMEGRWKRGQSLPGMPANLCDLFPDRLVDSELGEIPEGWEVKIISNIAEITYGKTLPSTKLTSRGVPVYGAGDVIGFFSETMYNFPVILVTCRGSGSGTVHETFEPAFVTNNSFVIIPKKSWYSRHFLKFWLKFADIQSRVSGSAQPQLTITNLQSLLVFEPSQSVMKLFHELADSLWEKIKSNRTECRTLATIRDTLLPKLISGEIRVKEAESFLKERGL